MTTGHRKAESSKAEIRSVSGTARKRGNKMQGYKALRLSPLRCLKA